jgi:hypothetical protein
MKYLKLFENYQEENITNIIDDIMDELVGRDDYEIGTHPDKIYVTLNHPTDEDTGDIGQSVVDFLNQSGENGWYVGNSSNKMFWITK